MSLGIFADLPSAMVMAGMAYLFPLARILLPFKRAPSQCEAENNSSVIGWYITPTMGFPLWHSAIDMQKMGMPLIKFTVPSIGSMIHK